MKLKISVKLNKESGLEYEIYLKQKWAFKCDPDHIKNSFLKIE